MKTSIDDLLPADWHIEFLTLARFLGFIGFSQQMISQASTHPQTSSTVTASPQTPHL
jgi:hypothetical protein